MMHSLSFCGNMLTANVSESWPVLLDSGAACLTLPSSLMDSVKIWLGDSIIEFGRDTWLVNTPLNKLPVLSFRLRPLSVILSDGGDDEGKNGSGEFMHIPLSSLVYTGTRYLPPQLCVVRALESEQTDSVVESLASSTTQKIVLGTMVMRNFIIAVDMQRGRVALANTGKALASFRVPGQRRRRKR